MNLISGKEALIALVDGTNVEACVTIRPVETEWHWFNAKNLSFSEIESEETMGLPDGSDIRKIVFRLNPRTITLNGIEVPAPFEPKENCIVFIFDDGKTNHYRSYAYEVDGDKRNPFMGMWRTEEEIKQVVAALRKVFKEPQQ